MNSPRLVKTAGIVLLAAASAGTATYLSMNEPVKNHDDIAGKADLVVTDASRDLKHTKIVADFDAKLVAGESVIWCSTMQLAWNELTGVISGDDGSMTVSNDREHLGEAMLKGRGSKDDIDASSCVALAGFGPGIVDSIKEQLQKAFGGAATPKLLPPAVPEGEILAYAYLFKNLEFATPFIPSKMALTFSGGNTIKTWGWWDDHLVDSRYNIAQQIHILAYDSPTSWIVELDTKASGDRLLIARLEPKETLGATVDAALAMPEGREPEQILERDTLRVPYLNFDITRNYNELVGVGVAGSKTHGTINKAVQNIRFKLDERGAVLKSEAAIGVTAAAPMPKDMPKNMICDGPFMIMMARKESKVPYYAAWISNAELLTKWR